MGIDGKSKIASVVEVMVLPVGVPQNFAGWLFVRDATCASSRSVCVEHPESMAASWGLLTRDRAW